MLGVYYLYWWVFVAFIFKFGFRSSSSNWKHLSTLVLDSKLILLCLGSFFLLWSASRICNFCLLFCCFNIVVFLVKFFRNSVLGQECFCRCCAIELVSDRCIVSRFDRVVEVKPYRRFINQFPPDTRKWMRRLERINTIIYKQGMSILFNQICINEEMLPKYTHTHTHTHIYSFISLVGRVFANGPGDLGSIPCRVIPKTLKIVLDTSLLNTQQHKVRIEGKVEQSRERSSTLPYTSV